MRDVLRAYLTEADAMKLWRRYVKALRRHRSFVPGTEWRAFEEDIEHHVLDHLNQNRMSGSECSALRDALEQLGPPDAIAESFAAQMPPTPRTLTAVFAVRGIEIVAALLRAILLSCAIVFTAMGVAHFFNQDVGLWLHGGGDWSLSFERQPEAAQALRGAFSFVAFAFSLLLIGFWRILSFGRNRRAG